MSLVLKLIILTVLGALAVQDFKSRSVYWFWMPVLALTFIGLNSFRVGNMTDYWWPVLCNLDFIALQLIILSAYYSLRKKQFINITERLLGWGDILFLISIAFYLSALNFVFFYVTSLIAVLFCWGVWRLISGKADRFIPLAGFHAVFLLFILVGDWFCFHVNVTDDFWLWYSMFY
ncbi:hypothetical protein ABIC84_001794 [Mucilaginibacter sp. 3215]